jgi:hypothetical protein
VSICCRQRKRLITGAAGDIDIIGRSNLAIDSATTTEGHINANVRGDLIANNVVAGDGAINLTAFGDVAAVNIIAEGLSDDNDINITTYDLDGDGGSTAHLVYTALATGSGGLGDITLNIDGSIFEKNANLLQADVLDITVENSVNLRPDVNTLLLESRANGDVTLTAPDIDPFMLNDIFIMDGSLNVLNSYGDVILENVVLGNNRDDNDLIVNALGSVEIGNVKAGVYSDDAAESRLLSSQSDVSITAGGSILEYGEDDGVDLITDQVTLSAQGDIADFEISANDLLNVESATGNINLTESDGYGELFGGLKVTHVSSLTGSVTLEADQGMWVSGAHAGGSTDLLTLTSEAGNIIIEEPASGDALSYGSGYVLNAAGNLNIDKLYQAQGGYIEMRAGGMLNLPTGDLNLTAAEIILDSGSVLTINLDDTLTATDRIELSSGSNVMVYGTLTSGSATAIGEVAINARADTSITSMVMDEDSGMQVYVDSGDTEYLFDLTSNSYFSIGSDDYGPTYTELDPTADADLIAGLVAKELVESGGDAYMDMDSLNATKLNIAAVRDVSILMVQDFNLSGSVAGLTPGSAPESFTLQSAGNLTIGSGIYRASGETTIKADNIDAGISSVFITDNLVAEADSITLNTNANTIEAVSPGDITIKEADDVDLVNVVSTSGAIDIIAGQTLTATNVETINDTTANHITLNAGVNIFADRVEAGSSVGAYKEHANVTLDAATGTIAEPVGREDDGIDVFGYQVNIESGIAMAADAVDIGSVLSYTPTVSMDTSAGDLSVDVIGDYLLMLVNGHEGDIDIKATGVITVVSMPDYDGRDVIMNADEILFADAVNVGSSGSIDLTANSNIQTSGLMTAGVLNVVQEDGPLTMATDTTQMTFDLNGVGDLIIDELDDSTVTATVANGGAELTAGGTLTVTDITLNTNSDDNDIVITTGGGIDAAVLNAGEDGDITLTANGGEIIVSSLATGDELSVAAAGGINIQADVVDAELTTTATGDILLTNTGELNVSTITAADGAVALNAGGDLIIDQVLSQTNSDSNDISLTATDGGSMILGTLDTGNLGDINLDSATTLQVESLIGDELVITAGGFVTFAGDVNSADITTTATGDVDITELNNIALTNIDVTDGQIDVNAGGSITNASITAQNGAVTLDAQDNISVIQIDSQAGQDIILDAGGNITIDNGSGDGLTTSGSGEILLTAGTGSTMTINSTVSTVDGDIRLTGEHVAITGPVFTGAAGTLHMNPVEVDTSIGLGDGSTGTYNLDQSELDNLQAGGTGAVVIGQTDGSHLLDIGESSGSVVFDYNVTLNTPSLGGHITQNASITTTDTHTYTVNGSGSTYEMKGDMDVGGDLTIHDMIALSGDRSMASRNGNILLENVEMDLLTGDGDAGTGDDNLTITTTGDLLLQGRVGSVKPSTNAVTDLTFENANSISFEDRGVLAGNLSMDGVGEAVFEQSLIVNGNFEATNGQGAVYLEESLRAGNIDLATTGSITFDRLVDVGAGNILLKGDEVDFNGGSQSVMGQGTLTLLPGQLNQDISIGSPSSVITSDFNISDVDLDALLDGFSTIIIGQESTGSGLVEVGSANVADSISIFGNQVELTGTLETSSGNITIQAKSGAILDTLSEADDTAYETANIIATGTITLRATEGIGSDQENGDLEIQTRVLDAVNSGSTGQVNIVEMAGGGALDILQVAQTDTDNSDGIQVIAERGTISVMVDGSGITSAGAGDILITAAGPASDIFQMTVITSEGGNINLDASRDISLHQIESDGATVSVLAQTGVIRDGLDGEGANITTGEVLFDATFGIGATDDIDLNVDTLSAWNRGTSGDIRFNEVADGSNLTVEEVAQTHLDGVGRINIVIQSGDMNVKAIQGYDAITLTAIGGAILDGSADNELINVAGEDVVLLADQGIGRSDSDLDINASTLEAVNTTSGGIFLHEADDLTITGQGLLTQAGNGSAILTTDGGTLTINSGVNVHGVGNIRLDSGGNMEINTNLTSTAGVISLLASDVMDLAEDVTVGTTGSMVINVGSLDMKQGSAFQTGGGNLRLDSVGDAVLGRLDVRTVTDQEDGTLAEQADWGAVSITTGGDVLDNAADGLNDEVNVFASDFRIDVGGSLAHDSNLLETEVVTLTLQAMDGAFIRESSQLEINTVDIIQVDEVQSDDSIVVIEDDDTQSGLDVYGELGLQNLAGNITVAGDGIQAKGGRVYADSALLIQSDVLAGTSRMEMIGASISTHADITSIGNLELNALAGDVTMNEESYLVSHSGSVTIRAVENVNLAQVRSLGTINISADSDHDGSGAIINILQENESGFIPFNLTSENIVLFSGSGIGTSNEYLLINGSTLSAVNRYENGIFINQSGNLEIIGQGLQNSAQDNGEISLIVDSGTLFVNAVVTAYNTVTLDSFGKISQDANITAGDDINLTSRSGGITMLNGVTSQADSGDISYAASGDVLLSLLQAQGEVAVSADPGAILDNLGTPRTDDESPNIVATSARLSATDGIGELPDNDFRTDEDGLNTQVEQLIAVNTLHNGIFIEEKYGLTINGDGLQSINQGRVLLAVANGKIENNSSVTSSIEIFQGSHLYPWEKPYLPSFEKIFEPNFEAEDNNDKDYINGDVDDVHKPGSETSIIDRMQIINDRGPLNQNLFGSGYGNLMAGLFDVAANDVERSNVAEERLESKNRVKPKSIESLISSLTRNPVSSSVSSLFNTFTPTISQFTESIRSFPEAFTPPVNRIEPLIPDLVQSRDSSLGDYKLNNLGPALMAPTEVAVPKNTFAPVNNQPASITPTVGTAPVQMNQPTQLTPSFEVTPTDMVQPIGDVPENNLDTTGIGDNATLNQNNSENPVQSVIGNGGVDGQAGDGNNPGTELGAEQFQQIDGETQTASEGDRQQQNMTETGNDQLQEMTATEEDEQAVAEGSADTGAQDSAVSEGEIEVSEGDGQVSGEEGEDTNSVEPSESDQADQPGN